MKKFRVREVYMVKGWTYVDAKDEKDAENKLDTMEVADTDFVEDDRYHEDIEWGSLEEVRND